MKSLVILQRQRARRRRRKALQRLKSFREPPMLVFGAESTSSIVVEANTVSKDPTAGRTNKETTVKLYHAS
jgi:hypothetical protein